LCWVLTATDLDLAEPGSTLQSIVQKLRDRGDEKASNSWLAWTTREGLLDNQAPGGFRRLAFDIWIAQKSKDKLLEALSATVEDIKREAAGHADQFRLSSFVSGIGSSLAASLIMELFKLPGSGLH
jgi:hypothetical protein